MNLNFVPITEDNYRECIRLKVKEEQAKYVSDNNAYALAKAYVFRDESFPYAIYLGDLMIGFVLIRNREDLGNYAIEKIMIARDYQGKGYGKEALSLIIRNMKKEKKFNKLCICCHVENVQALNLLRLAKV